MSGQPRPAEARPAEPRPAEARPAEGAALQAPFGGLRSLWFQVTGLRCNLACTHCLVRSAPDNLRLDDLELGAVCAYLEAAEALGVGDYYFTGGEPFMHRDIVAMLAATLEVGPATVLTNGTLIDARLADQLQVLAAGSRYSLEIRLSLDDVVPEVNDRVRGKQVLRRVERALRLLDARGLLPILTATEIIRDAAAARAAGIGSPPSPPPRPSPSPPAAGGAGGARAAGDPAPANEALYERFRRFLLGLGIAKPRVKILPVFRTGRLDGLAAAAERLRPEMLAGFDYALLQCHTARVVAADGIYACPILVAEECARVAPPGALGAACGPVDLAHTACHTCYVTGMTCGNG